ncbi:MAG: MFS transporter [Janthinobacterium lividum]
MTQQVIAAPGFPSWRTAHRALLVLGLLAFVTSMDITMTSLLVEPMKRELVLSDIQIGFLQGTVYGIGYGLSAMPLGRLIDSRTRTRLLLAGMLVWAVAMAATALAHGVGLLLVCRVLLGVVTALVLPASISLIADLFAPTQRTVATSLFATGQACGQAFGILAGGLVFDRLTWLVAWAPAAFHGLSPWRVEYIGAGILCLVLAPLLLMMDEPARHERDATRISGREALLELWSYRRFVAPLIAAMLFSVIALQATMVWAAPLLIRRFGQTPGQFAGWLSGITLVGGILGALAGGRLAELGRRRLGAGGVLLPALIAALASVPLALFGLAPTVPVFALLLGLSLFCGGLIQTIGVVAFTLNIPNEIRGLGIGVYVLIVALFGTATAPTAVAVVSRLLGGEDRLGLAIAAVSAPAMLVSALFFGLAMRNAARRTAG